MQKSKSIFVKRFLTKQLLRFLGKQTKSAFSDPQLGNDATYALSLSKNVQLSQSQIHSTAVSHRKRTGKARSEDQKEQPFICSPKVTLPLIASDRLAESMLLFTVAR